MTSRFELSAVDDDVEAKRAADARTFTILEDDEPEDFEEVFILGQPRDYVIFLTSDVADGYDINSVPFEERYVIEEYYLAAWEDDDPKWVDMVEYECSHGNGVHDLFLDRHYGILSEEDGVHGPGAYVVMGISGYFTLGDGYTTDDDCTMEYEGVRPATPEEAFRALGAPGASFWDSEPGDGISAAVA
jgi:hypothetical protein